MVRAKYLMRRRNSVRENTTAREVIFKLMANNYPGLPVVNDNREVIGIVTEFDLLGMIRDGRDIDSITAGEIMSKEVVTAGVETSQKDLIAMMLEHHLTIIPVVRDKRLVGIVSRMEIMDAYVDPDLYKQVEAEEVDSGAAIRISDVGFDRFS